MKLRSLLFVPGDRPDRMEKAAGSAADALILDLEDSVAAARKPMAREVVAEFLVRGSRPMPVFVRVNSLQSGLVKDDLAAVMHARPDGIMLPKAEGGASIAALDQMLGARPAMILPIATETPAAIFRLGSFAGISKRLCGISWGVEDLSAAVGAAGARDGNGEYTQPYEMVRGLTLFAAGAAGVAAIDAVYPDFRDEIGLARYAARGRRDGFAGMLAIHPAQIAVINAAFAPTADELAWARKVVELFEANPGVGVFALEGKMVDLPHLVQAKRILGQGK